MWCACDFSSVGSVLFLFYMCLSVGFVYVCDSVGGLMGFQQWGFTAAVAPEARSEQLAVTVTGRYPLGLRKGCAPWILYWGRVRRVVGKRQRLTEAAFVPFCDCAVRTGLAVMELQRGAQREPLDSRSAVRNQDPMKRAGERTIGTFKEIVPLWFFFGGGMW